MLKDESLTRPDCTPSLSPKTGSGFNKKPHRREFLRIIASAGTAAIYPLGLMAQTGGVGSSRRVSRIDVHHHMRPPFYAELRRESIHSDWTPSVSIEQMDKYGVETAIASSPILIPNDPLIDGTQKARGVARGINEYGAKMMMDFPHRFGLFASLPFPDQDGSLREIEFAFDTLKADGINLATNYGDKWLGDPSYVPVFEELNRRQAVVICHPTTPNCCRTLVPDVPSSMSEVDFDTTRTVESLLVNGTLSRFPNVRFIFCHSGGTLPVLGHRLADRFPKERLDRVPHGVPYELGRLYFEVAHATYPEPLTALTKFTKMPQILFGTDYPAEPIATTANALDQSGLSNEDLYAVDRGNAESLFPRLRK